MSIFYDDRSIFWGILRTKHAFSWFSKNKCIHKCDTSYESSQWVLYRYVGFMVIHLICIFLISILKLKTWFFLDSISNCFLLLQVLWIVVHVKWLNMLPHHLSLWQNMIDRSVGCLGSHSGLVSMATEEFSKYC